MKRSVAPISMSTSPQQQPQPSALLPMSGGSGVDGQLALPSNPKRSKALPALDLAPRPQLPAPPAGGGRGGGGVIAIVVSPNAAANHVSALTPIHHPGPQLSPLGGASNKRRAA